MVAAILVAMCGAASAEPAGNDWYGALRLGYQPYTLEVEGTFRGQDFDAEADLSDIMDQFDTTIAGGELEIGKGRYFFLVSAFYQETEIEEGQAVLDVVGTFTKTAINPMLGTGIPGAVGRRSSRDL
jgi:opacity protein-like surface antigen